MKQTSLFKNKKCRGKIRRALAAHTETHLILRSSVAKGEMSLRAFHNERQVQKIVRRQATLAGVQVLSFVNIGSHLHLIIKFSHKNFYVKFVRAVTGLIARRVLKAQKGSRSDTRFFDHPVFTRVLKSYRELQVMKHYIFKNEVEAIYGHQTRAELERIDFFSNEAYHRRDELLGVQTIPEPYFGQMSFI